MRLHERIKAWFRWMFTKPEPVPYWPIEPVRMDCDEVPPTPKEVAMARKDEKTSKRVSSNASAALRDPKASAREKSLAGSALTQTADRKRKPPKAKAKVKGKKRAAH
jgi:hypothetical protein